jgi:hypothetical protein
MAAADGQPHNLGSFPVTTLQELVKEGRHMSALQLQLAKYSQPWYTHWYVLWLARGLTPQHWLSWLRCQGTL